MFQALSKQRRDVENKQRTKNYKPPGHKGTKNSNGKDTK